MKPNLIYAPLMGKEMEITGVLIRLASQENCDGEPYDQMMEAARYIKELEAIVDHWRNKPCPLSPQSYSAARQSP